MDQKRNMLRDDDFQNDIKLWKHGPIGFSAWGVFCVFEHIHKEQQMKTKLLKVSTSIRPSKQWKCPVHILWRQLLFCAEFVHELTPKDLWIRQTELSWHLFIFVTIRELPFQEFLWKTTREVEGQRGQDRGSREAEDSKKLETRSGTLVDGSHRLGLGNISPSFSAWREWNSKKTRDRSDWQSTDWLRWSAKGHGMTITVLMTVKSEDIIFENSSKDIHDVEITSVYDWQPRYFYHLSFVSLLWCEQLS